MVAGKDLLSVAQSLRDSVHNFPELLLDKLGTDKVWVIIQMVDWESYPDRYLAGAFFQKTEAIRALPTKRLEREIGGELVFYNLVSSDPTVTKEMRSEWGEREMNYYETHRTHGNGLLILKEVSLASIRQENLQFYKDLMTHLLGL